MTTRPQDDEKTSGRVQPQQSPALAPSTGCCAPAEQGSCCEPADKAACCGDSQTHGCGCK